MEGNRAERRDEVRPQLLDLIPKDSEWVFSRRDDMVAGEARKLELSLGLGLGPPGHWPNKTSPFLKKPTVSPPPHENPHKRSGQAQVVGWPPIRSSRKNLSKPISTESTQNVKNDNVNNKTSRNDNNNNNGGGVGDERSKKRGMFVKINMEGVPIGRKLDLNAYDNYHSLEDVVDHLFRGLLAAQRDSSEDKAIRGLLDGSGEYTLVYEDNEGDRMLVGDVPWNMFVSTVKRLRVLKSSQLSSLSRLVSKAT